MPRQLDGTALFRKLLSLDLYKISTGTFGDTTTTAPVIGDGSETTIGVTATTNFTAADYAFCIGDGGTELFKVGTPAVSMPITYKPKIPQSTGARFVEATKVSLGKLGEGGVNITPSKSLTAINSSVDDFPINYLDGVLEVSFSVPLLEWSNVNWALITGYADDETGAGTTGDPYQTIIGKINQTLQGSQVFRLNGIRFDGKYGQIDLLDAHVEVSQGIDHNRQAPAVMVLAGKCTKLIARQATAAFPGSVSESLAWDEEGLQQRCTDLRETLLQSNMSTPAEVEMYWPGGAQNREEPPGDWIYCYAQLCGMLRREETPAQMQERQQAEAAVLAALREEPESVELIARDAEGGPVHLHVYPKSFDTLCHVMARDLELLKLAAVLSLLHEAGVGLVTERGRAIYEEISYQNRVLAWIVTSEGVNLPYPADNPRPDIPEWTQALDAADVVRVLRAHQRVNGQRIALIGDLLGAGSKGGKKSRGPGWATLAALAATELGTSSRSLLRDWSLAGWLAQMLLAQDAKAEALAEAKAEHSHGR